MVGGRQRTGALVLPRTRLASSLAALAAGALLLSGCGGTTTAPGQQEKPESGSAGAAPEEITVTHAQGETTVPVNPERVLTFDFAALTTLDALDVDVWGLPKQNLPG